MTRLSKATLASPDLVTEIRAIAVAIDGSSHAQHALEEAIRLAGRLSASLTIVGVVPAHTVYSVQRRAELVEPREEDVRLYQELLTRATETARKAGVASVSKELLQGEPVEEILTFLGDRHPDLLVMGARGLSTARRLLLGSVSDGVAHHAHCSILIVRPPP